MNEPHCDRCATRLPGDGDRCAHGIKIRNDCDACAEYFRGRAQERIEWEMKIDGIRDRANEHGIELERARIVTLLETYEERLVSIVSLEDDPQMRARLGVYAGMAQDIREGKQDRVASPTKSLIHNELMRALDVMHVAAGALAARRLLATKREVMTTPIYESMTTKAWNDAKIEAHLLDAWELIVMAIHGHTELECSGCKDAKGQWVGPCEDGCMHRSWCSTGIREVRRQNGSPMDNLVCAPMVPKGSI